MASTDGLLLRSIEYTKSALGPEQRSPEAGRQSRQRGPNKCNKCRQTNPLETQHLQGRSLVRTILDGTTETSCVTTRRQAVRSERNQHSMPLETSGQPAHCQSRVARAAHLQRPRRGRSTALMFLRPSSAALCTPTDISSTLKAQTDTHGHPADGRLAKTLPA
jgi:hypothetical protein